MMGQRRHGMLFDRGRARGWLLAALASCALAGGCAQSGIETEYGRQRGWGQDASVNGTDIFAGMFEAAGHEVDSRRVLLTQAMQSVETIVWFPNDFQAPSQDVCDWFEEWLASGPRRTLIYVGRSFDAAPQYWRKMAPRAPAEFQEEYRANETQATVRARVQAEEDRDEEELTCDWFRIEPAKSRDVHKPGGPWSAGVDAAHCEIELGNKLLPSLKIEQELTADNDVLVATARESHWDDGQIIFVANGSFLLNLPLVNAEHRKLAGRLVRAAAPGRVIFIESGPGGPAVDPPQADNSMWKVFGAWPLNGVLLHLAVLGLIFCFARWPIFGRPRVPAEAYASDFAKHVEAMGELLRRTKDRAYAEGKLAEGDIAAGKSVQ